jgi:surface polysaccharide O-acyltransferase-like enzyme
LCIIKQATGNRQQATGNRQQATGNRQYYSIDLFKAIMAIFVVAIHTHPFEGCTSEYFMNIYDMIVSSAVPFFFITSGFLLFEKIDNLKNLEKLWMYLIKIIKLYSIWTLIYMPLTIYGYIINSGSLFRDILSFIRGTFFIGEHYNSWILWYLLSTIYSLLLIGILLKFAVKIRIIYIISILLFIFGNTMTFLVNNIPDLQGTTEKVVKIFRYIFGSGRLFTGMFYIATGMVIVRNKQNISPIIYIIVMIIGIFCKLFAPKLISLLSIGIYSVMLFLIIISKDIKGHKIFYRFREASTIFYFFHLICWSVYTIVIIDLPNHCGFDSFIITILGCIIISSVLIYLKRYKMFKWIRAII